MVPFFYIMPKILSQTKKEDEHPLTLFIPSNDAL